jgi:hypothetical protein
VQMRGFLVLGHHALQVARRLEPKQQRAFDLPEKRLAGRGPSC